MNLSEDQKGKLQGFLTEAYEKLQQYKIQNHNASGRDSVNRVAENRSAIRERLVKFLYSRTAHEVDSAMAKEFLGQKMAGSA